MTEPFQILPPLSSEEIESLEADIEARGIIVPIVVDQNGVVVDGHHRQAAATKLGVACPTEVREFSSDLERVEVALGLNLSRRHLNQAQKRALVEELVRRFPDLGNRRIAALAGVSSHNTVRHVRVRAEMRAQAGPSRAREQQREAYSKRPDIQRQVEQRAQAILKLARSLETAPISAVQFWEVYRGHKDRAGLRRQVEELRRLAVAIVEEGPR